MALLEAGGLEAVFLANRPRLLAFLRAHGAGDAAEDLLQELWVKSSAAATAPIAQPLAYLYRAANNLMLDRHRAKRQSDQREQGWARLGDGVIPGSSDAPSSERTLIAREQLAAAEAALEGVGSRAATVFRRYRLEGVSQRDVAIELGISLSTVESDLRRAYRAMIDLRRTFDEV